MDFSAKLENLQVKVNETVETAGAATLIMSILCIAALLIMSDGCGECRGRSSSWPRPSLRRGSGTCRTTALH
jgi:hypothetical protein